MEDKAKEAEAKLASMEADKERKIRHYMELQDQADAMNEQIYKVCCEVEGLNVQINALKEELKKAALKAVKPPNGVHKSPANGSGSGH
jgi:predicted  nucleic acid-binding Zn-ribbon protein